MNISRHNYEEFFILYLDNELAADERRAVEAFVQAHPDLKEELELLQQYKLEPDTSLVFAGKEELMKVNGETPISLSNYEEWLVLYHDDELSPAQRTIVEGFMLTHPSLHQESEQLKRAKLQAETIVFPGKASLYREEEKVRRFPAWWRIAAAAVLLIAIGISAVIIINNNSEPVDKGIAGKNIPANKVEKNDAVINPPSPGKENIAVDNDQEQQQGTAEQIIRNPVKSDPVAVNPVTPSKKEKIKDIIIPEPVKEEPVVAVRKTNELPVPLRNPDLINNNTGSALVANAVPSENIQRKDALTKPVVTSTDPDPSDFVTASLDQSEKKNKGRGFFRKIARTFEKRTDIDPTDDNRLLVAGLSIKLK